jgi:membrane-associated phospholipid phosphatase
MHAPEIKLATPPERNSEHAGRAPIARWFFVAGVAAALFLIVLALVAAGATSATDRSTELAIHREFGAATMPLFSDISLVGGSDGRAMVVVLVTVGLLLARKLWSTVFLLLVQAGSIVGEATKVLVHRTRPHLFADAYHAAGYSFPSGHTLGATLLWGALVFLLWARLRRPRTVVIAGVIAVAWVALVALSRVVLGVHYPSDVEGGAALGLAWTYGMIGVLGRRVQADV